MRDHGKREILLSTKRSFANRVVLENYSGCERGRVRRKIRHLVLS
jgi:hypothetical protein